MNKATIRKARGGYIVEVRWPFAGNPLNNGEAICKTFDEAVTYLAKHLGSDIPIGKKCLVAVRDSNEKDTFQDSLDAFPE